MKAIRISLPHDQFEAVLSGALRHTVQKGLTFEERSVLCIEEMEADAVTPTGREVSAAVTYVTSAKNHCALSPTALKDGYSILSFEVQKK